MFRSFYFFTAICIIGRLCQNPRKSEDATNVAYRLMTFWQKTVRIECDKGPSTYYITKMSIFDNPLPI